MTYLQQASLNDLLIAWLILLMNSIGAMRADESHGKYLLVLEPPTVSIQACFFIVFITTFRNHFDHSNIQRLSSA